MACTAQSVKTEHGITKEEDTEYAPLTQTSTDSLILRCQQQQSTLRGAMTMNLEVKRPGFTTSLVLTNYGIQSQLSIISEPRVFMYRRKKKEKVFMAKRKTFFKAVVKITWGEKVQCLVQGLAERRHSAKDRENHFPKVSPRGRGPWLLDCLCIPVLSNVAHVEMQHSFKHLLNEFMLTALRKAREWCKDP